MKKSKSAKVDSLMIVNEDIVKQNGNTIGSGMVIDGFITTADNGWKVAEFKTNSKNIKTFISGLRKILK